MLLTRNLSKQILILISLNRF